MSSRAGKFATVTVRDSFLAVKRADCLAPGASTEWLDEAADDFEVLRRTCARHPHPIAGPSSILWYVSGEHYLGRLVTRHRLTPQLAEAGGRSGYPRARYLGPMAGVLTGTQSQVRTPWHTPVVAHTDLVESSQSTTACTTLLAALIPVIAGCTATEVRDRERNRRLLVSITDVFCLSRAVEMHERWDF